MLSETAARWMLVLHTALGVAAVGAATHLVLWSREFLRGKFGRLPAVRRFSRILVVVQVLAFVAGNVMYPTYRIEVRAAYLESRDALVADRAVRQAQLDRLAAREAAGAPQLASVAERARDATSAVRWFDVKEHWIALGVLAALALALVLAFWDPRTAGRELAPVIVGLAVFVAASLWLGAIIGVLTASWRAI